MAIEKPQLYIGLPIGDPNFGWPGAGDLAASAWTIGSNIEGNVKAVQENTNSTWVETVNQAARRGVGRSPRIAITTAMTGNLDTDFVLSPPTPYGYVPQAAAMKMFAPITYFGAYHADVEIKVYVYQYTSLGALTRTYIGTLTHNNSSGYYDTENIYGNVTWGSDAQYARLGFLIDSNGETGWFTPDFASLGMIPSVASPAYAEFDDNYGCPFSFTWTKDTKWAQYGPWHRAISSGPGWKRTIAMMSFDLADSKIADRLAFFKSVQDGTPTVGDNVINPGTAYQEGKMWPLLLVTGRGGEYKQKGAFYCIMDHDEFPLDIDNRLGHVPDVGRRSGQVVFKEIFF